MASFRYAQEDQRRHPECLSCGLRLYQIILTNFLQETQSRGWICPECQREYDTIQADRLLDMVRQCFVCEVCDTELEDNTNSAKVQGSKDRMRRFNAQMKWIRDAIRATEGIVLPG